MTLKIRRQDVRLGQRVDGRLDVPGRVDIYSFDPEGAEKVLLDEIKECGKLSADVAMDERAQAGSPDPLSWGVSVEIATRDSGKRQALMVWSDEAKTADYGFVVKRA